MSVIQNSTSGFKGADKQEDVSVYNSIFVDRRENSPLVPKRASCGWVKV